MNGAWETSNNFSTHAIIIPTKSSEIGVIDHFGVSDPVSLCYTWTGDFTMIEKRYRSIVKTFSWRTIATLTTTLIAYLLTGQIKVAISIGCVEFFAKIALYYWHERIWNSLAFGREFPTDYQI